MTPYFRLLRRNRDFRRVFAAELVVLGGDWFAVIPLVSLLYQLTGTGLWGGLVLAADTLVFAALSPYAGTVADRVDRRRLMIAANLVSAVLVLLLLFVRTAGTAWVALVAIGGVAAMKAFYQPAGAAALPNLVDADDLSTANVLIGSAWGTMLAVGASLGGLVAQLVGTDLCLLIDSACLLVGAAFTARCRRPFQLPREGTSMQGAGAALGEALRYVRSEPRVRALMTAKAGVGLGNGPLALFPLLALSVYAVGPLGTGLLFAARGLGALVGPLVLRGRLLRPGALLPGLALSMSVYGTAYLLLPTVPWFGLALLVVVVAHMGGGANWVLSSYGLQATVPDALRGRVFSADIMLATLAVGLSQLVVGGLTTRLPVGWLAAGSGAVTLLYAGGWSVATTRVRGADRLQERTA
jgi:hypothetical protein